MHRKNANDRHFVDIWNHEELSFVDSAVPVTIAPFNRSFLGTNNEGSVSAIAAFHPSLKISLQADQKYACYKV